MDYIEYTFEIIGRAKAILPGYDTDENYDRAVDEALRRAVDNIDVGWVGDHEIYEFCKEEYEHDYL